MPRLTSPSIAVAACFAELPAGAAPSEFRLIPAGLFRAWDGRPGEGLSWQLHPERAQAICDWAADRTSDLVLDYEHATLTAQATGAKAPAAAWWKSMEWRDDGLYAVNVRWTDAAAAMVAAGEKRYISPVFGWDKKTGEVLSVVMAGLVNNPGLDGLTDLSALAALAGSLLTPTETLMDKLLEQLLERLGWFLDLPTGATIEDYIVQIDKIKTQLQAALPATAAASFDLAQYLETSRTELAALTAQVAQPDPAKFVPVATMSALQADLKTANEQLAALNAQAASAKLDQVITEALSAHKLAPAQEEWARQLGGQNLASLTAYLETVVPVVPQGTQTHGQAPTETAALAATFKAPAGYGVSAAGMELHTAALAYQATHPGVDYEAAVTAVAKP